MISCALVSLIYLVNPVLLRDHNKATVASEQKSYSATFTGYIATADLENNLPFVVNNSTEVVYYIPESSKYNPGMDPKGIYSIKPGESLHFPVDGLVTSGTYPGHVYKVPTGGSVTIDRNGVPVPTNLVGILGTALSFGHYGDVTPPDPNFARLATVGVLAGVR
jgi:hypothetical protein